MSDKVQSHVWTNPEHIYLHYTTIHYNFLYYTTLHFIQLHYTTLVYSELLPFKAKKDIKKVKCNFFQNGGGVNPMFTFQEIYYLKFCFQNGMWTLKIGFNYINVSLIGNKAN